MSVKPKTIDNLGDDVSLKYIENQEALKETSLQEGFVGDLTTVLSQSPYHADWEEFQLRYVTNRHKEPWADFLPPPGFFSSMKRLFTHQLIPSMGTPEKQEALLEKLEKVRYRKKPAKKKKQEKFSRSDREEEHQRQEEETQSQIIENLIHLLQKLDKDLGLVNMLRNQYHKG